MNVLICICTYKRNKSLYKCIKSFEKAILPSNVKINFLILDNTINNNSFGFVNNLEKNFKFKILQKNEKKRGVVFARNKCLRVAKKINCEYIAFFDDDCEIDKYWFKNVYKIINQTSAEILTGPQIHKKNNKLDSKKYEYINEIFEKKIYKKLSNVNWAATNNVLIKKSIITKENIFFDKNLNKFGMGEDQLFFSKLSNLGYKIVWSDKIKVYEINRKHRTKIKWMIQRSYRLGVLGHYIDLELHGLFFGYIINYLKFIYYLFISILSLTSFKESNYKYKFINFLTRAMGRLMGPFVFKKIQFYKK